MTPRDNRHFNRNNCHSKSIEMSLPVISVSLPLNNLVINPPQLSLVRQQSSSSSPNTTNELQAYSIPGSTSPDPSNTMPPPYTNDGSRNIYGCMVDVSKFTLAQRKQNAVMLLEQYHELRNTNDPSSTFVSPPPIPNIESFSQSTISSLGSGSFNRNRADGDNQQPTTSEVANTETVLAGNKDIDTPPPQDI